MLVFLGNPLDNSSPLYSFSYYLTIGGMILTSLLFFKTDLSFFRTDQIHATFLKIVLISEQRRETRGFKFIFILLQVFYVGWISYVSFYDIPKALKECLEKNVHDCDVLKPPMDSVRPSSINFWILLFTWLLACYNVLNYNDCYQGLMLPKTQFMAKHFPDELKIAKERYPKALADKNDASGPVLTFCSNLLVYTGFT